MAPVGAMVSGDIDDTGDPERRGVRLADWDDAGNAAGVQNEGIWWPNPLAQRPTSICCIRFVLWLHQAQCPMLIAPEHQAPRGRESSKVRIGVVIDIEDQKTTRFGWLGEPDPLPFIQGEPDGALAWCLADLDTIGDAVLVKIGDR